MKKILSGIAVLLALSLISCNTQEPDYSGTAAPSIELMYDTITPDLNRVDNTPVVCVVFSEAGLKKVSLYKTEGGQEFLVSETDSFKDKHQFSMKETPSWNTGITSLSVRAEDLAGRKAEAVINVNVTPVLPAPVIKFERDKIEINERNEDPNEIETRFEVTSSNTLQSVKVSLFTSEGVLDVPLNPAFRAGEPSYSFSQTITFFEGYRGVQVSATDANGKMKIETLPVNYIPAPAPIMQPIGDAYDDPLVVKTTDSRSFSFNVTAETGLANIEVVKLTKDIQGKDVNNRIAIEYYDSSKDFDVNYSYTIDSFTTDSHALLFIATDRLGHSATVRIPTFVNLRYGENIVIAAQRNTKEPLILDEFPGVESYCFFSVRDFKTYSLFDFWKTENRRNIDFFYFAWNNGGASDNGTRLMRANEDRAGQDPSWFTYINSESVTEIPTLSASSSDWGGRNGTYIKKLTNAYAFDFDNVTVADLTDAALQSYVVQGKTNADWINYKAGDCFVFKTGPASTYPNSTGIVRFERVEGSRDSFTGNNALPNDKPCYILISIKTQVVE
ncbi:MAG: hypothetical protein J6X82_04755 [Bacteroidales bacterium]|nr:hypothetical protein [Bacteroidales bacterium]